MEHKKVEAPTHQDEWAQLKIFPVNEKVLYLILIQTILLMTKDALLNIDIHCIFLNYLSFRYS